jgi:tetratricopeptide (TPR) repeat protein
MPVRAASIAVPLCVLLAVPAAAAGEVGADRLLETAAELSRGGDWAAAREAWLEVARRLDGRPEGVRAAYRAAVLAYERLDAKAVARAELRRLVSRHPGAIQAPRALRRLALEHPEGPPRLAFYAGAYRALGQSPLGPEIAYRCGRHAEEAGLPEAALDCYHRVLRRHADHPHAGDARFRIARILHALGHLDAAIAAYRAILLDDVPSGRPLDRQDRAVGPHLPIRHGARHGPEAWLGLGEALLERGDRRAAEAAFENLLHYHPDHTRLRVEAFRHLARIRQARGDEAGARWAWRRLLEEAPWSRHAPEAEANLR